ncbi:ABC transporter permease [Spongiimicrobium salis]|uniref:ABC transporter permease n=1 Tax=Spongiimicrobium salis TaxID=1667022 RepID=UPI00374CDA72
MLKRLGIRLLKCYCHPDFQEDILGDLEEHYQNNQKEKGRLYANFKFFIDVLLLFRLSLLRTSWGHQNYIPLGMIHTLFKTSFRVFWKERLYALFNVLGLTIGLTASALLLLYVESELSVNGFHKDIGQMYQVMENRTSSGIIYTNDFTPGPLHTSFTDDFPEVESMAAYTHPYDPYFILEDHRQRESGIWASADFFKIFQVHFIEGNAKSALNSPSQIYLSKSAKERLFGEEPALSKTIEVDGWGNFEVGGVFEDVPHESTINFDFVAPFLLWKQENTWVNEWGNSGISGIAKLRAGTDIDQFNAKIAPYIQEKMGAEEAPGTLLLQPFKERYLFTNYENGELTGGRILYVRLFSVVALFILLIASINFINLVTARSTKRAKEVGVKKVVGSSRRYLLLQFMTESVLLALFSALLAGFLVMLTIDHLNLLVGKNISFSLFNVDQSYKLMVIGLIVGLVSGIYPAVVLSNFKTIKVLKGSFRSSRSSDGLRKGLVVFQFVISTTLIIATLVIQKQLDFMENRELGFNKENLVMVPLEGSLRNSDVQAQLKSRLSENPHFTNVAFSGSSALTYGTSTDGGFSWAERDNELRTNFQIIQTDYDFLETYDMELVRGRSFDTSLVTDSLHVIINEQTAKIMNLEEPIGHRVTFWGRTGEIIGIVKDFHFRSLHSPIEPLIISLRPHSNTILSLRMVDQHHGESLAYLEELWKEYNPDYPFEYHFLEDNYKAQYQSETVIGTLGNYFSAIAIFISLLGLFGLASFAAEQRIKEIGIRKVLGAGALHIMLQMVKGFLLLVGIGFLLAVPISYFAMDDWLDAFTYHTEIGLSTFLMAGTASLLITIMTIAYHAIRAAHANPLKSLRYE